MRIETLWISRHSDVGGPPELLAARDEYSVDANPEGFYEDCERALRAVGSDVRDTRRVTLSVGGIESLFETPELKAVPVTETS